MNESTHGKNITKNEENIALEFPPFSVNFKENTFTLVFPVQDSDIGWINPKKFKYRDSPRLERLNGNTNPKFKERLSHPELLMTIESIYPNDYPGIRVRIFKSANEFKDLEEYKTAKIILDKRYVLNDRNQIVEQNLLETPREKLSKILSRLAEIREKNNAAIKNMRGNKY